MSIVMLQIVARKNLRSWTESLRLPRPLCAPAYAYLALAAVATDTEAARCHSPTGKQRLVRSRASLADKEAGAPFR